LESGIVKKGQGEELMGKKKGIRWLQFRQIKKGGGVKVSKRAPGADSLLRKLKKKKKKTDSEAKMAPPPSLERGKDL